MTKIQNISSVLLIFSLVIEGYAAILPNGIKRCKLSDPSLDSCMKKSSQKIFPLLLNGLPEIGIPSIEPLEIPDIYNDDPVLNFKFTDNKIFWANTAKIREFKIDQIKKQITISYDCSGYMNSHYSANGRLLIFPVVGEGESVMTMTGVTYVYKINYDVVKGKDGKDHWKILKHKVTYVPTHVNYKMTNLFNGNKQLADTILNFANENWKEIFGLLGKAPMKSITDTFVRHVATLFSKVPLDELFDT